MQASNGATPKLNRRSTFMPQTLRGSCRCNAVRFTCESRTPQPFMLCYCSICRKTAGGGGYAINLGADMASLKIEDPDSAIGVYRAEIRDDEGRCEVSSGERNFCTRCASALWLYDPNWPELVHPFASAIDSELPIPPSRVHMMLRFKPGWVQPRIDPDDAVFEEYPEQSLAGWHRARGLWID